MQTCFGLSFEDIAHADSLVVRWEIIRGSISNYSAKGARDLGSVCEYSPDKKKEKVITHKKI